jgi:hypothetical protein
VVCEQQQQEEEMEHRRRIKRGGATEPIRAAASNDSSRGSASTSRRARQFTERMRFLSRSRSGSGSVRGGTHEIEVSGSEDYTSGGSAYASQTTEDDSTRETVSPRNSRDTLSPQNSRDTLSPQNSRDSRTLSPGTTYTQDSGSATILSSNTYDNAMSSDTYDEGDDESIMDKGRRNKGQRTVPRNAAAPQQASTLQLSSTNASSSTLQPPLTPDFKDAPTPTANNISTPTRQARVPGGAAAKLMFLGPNDSDTSSLKETQSTLLQTASSESFTPNQDKLREIHRQMQQAKAEFEKGSEENRRYHEHGPSVSIPENVENDEDNNVQNSDKFETASDAPSFLNRSEIFHENPAAAVLALLTPRHSDHRSVVSGQDTESIVSGVAPNSSSPTRLGQSCPGATASNDNNFEPTVNRGGISQPLLSEHAQERLERLKAKMRDPDKTLTALLTAIATPDDHKDLDLGYMVRRKNACGALHMLTCQVQKRAAIGHTAGVLTALTTVLAHAQEAEAFSDPRIRAEYEAARVRAIAALVNLATPKENRMAVFHTPGLVQAVLHTISEDEREARRGCTSILAYLVKSPENRLLIAQVPCFMEVVTAVLRPKPTRVEPARPPRSKAVYPWTSKNSDDESEESEEEEEANSIKKTPQSSFNTSYSKTTEDSDGAGSKPVNDGDDSDGETPRVEGAGAPVEVSGYDETANKLLQASRQNLFALLVHVSKEKDNAHHFARDQMFVSTMVEISKYHESPSHVMATKLLANLTRHRLNTKILVFQQRTVAPALVAATQSPSNEARRFACYGLQNIAQDKSCRQEMATTKNLIVALCARARLATDEEERLAAVSALKNLCDEPANLIPMTNAPDCISTLMHVAHGMEAGVTCMMQYRACDALATLSHWLRKIATSGLSLEASHNGKPPVSSELFVPSLRVVTWNQWE